MVRSLVAYILLLLATTLCGAAGANETVLLDFSSPDCPPCRQMEPSIDRLRAEGHPVRKIDVTQNPQLAQQFRVTGLPTVVMLVNGREVERQVGFAPLGKLRDMLSAAGSRLSPFGSRQQAAAPDPFAAPGAPGRPSPWASNGRTFSGPPPGPPPQAAPPTDSRMASGAQPWPAGGAAQQHPPQQYGPQPGTAAAAAQAAAPLPQAQLAGRLIESSVRLRVDEGDGNSYGTGTIIDARNGKALIVTCGHIFRESQGQRPVTVELFRVTASGAEVAQRLPGQVLSYNLQSDIGLVMFDTPGPVRVAPMASWPQSAGPGDRAVSIGCNHGANPTPMWTQVTALDRYLIPPNIEAAGAPVQGRSGGGLFNDRGELIGVCLAADPQGNEGIYSALKTIHAELDRQNLTAIYAPGPRDAVAAAGQPAAIAGQTGLTAVQPASSGQLSMPPGSVVRGQSPGTIGQAWPVGAEEFGSQQAGPQAPASNMVASAGTPPAAGYAPPNYTPPATDAPPAGDNALEESRAPAGILAALSRSGSANAGRESAAEAPVSTAGAADVPSGETAGVASSSHIATAASTLSELNPAEQAAWEEIMTRAAEAEVVCIIRPKVPGGKSEVITLDSVSPEFIQALAAQRK